MKIEQSLTQTNQSDLNAGLLNKANQQAFEKPYTAVETADETPRLNGGDAKSKTPAACVCTFNSARRSELSIEEDEGRKGQEEMSGWSKGRLPSYTHTLRSSIPALRPWT